MVGSYFPSHEEPSRADLDLQNFERLPLSQCPRADSVLELQMWDSAVRKASMDSWGRLRNRRTVPRSFHA
jgi:hypothetical protein